MKQDATKRPELTLFRKASIASGAALDHAGKVEIVPIENFDLDRTIFKTLEGAAARFVVKTRVAIEPVWDHQAGEQVERDYRSARENSVLPEIDPALLRFMVDECDFDVEHADGSFLDHLYFCFEYSAAHYPEQSARVMLLHSILGTGTNTFAMEAEKIPALRELLDDFDWRHIEAFPSVLRLLYSGGLRRELRDNIDRASSLSEVRFRRVIDNEAVTMTGDDFWIQLNYQLIHLIDFLPVANWTTHRNDTAFILFRDLRDLLVRAGRLAAKVNYTPAKGRPTFKGEPLRSGLLATLIPVSLSEKMAARSVSQFSSRIGHSLDYDLGW